MFLLCLLKEEKSCFGAVTPCNGAIDASVGESTASPCKNKTCILYVAASDTSQKSLSDYIDNYHDCTLLQFILDAKDIVKDIQSHLKMILYRY